MKHAEDRAFSFLDLNPREGKPRKSGITEIRGPYYTPMGKRGLEDLLETMGEYVDILKFAGGSFVLMPRKAVRGLIDLCHACRVSVSTGGFIESVLARRPRDVDRYLGECADLGFDIVEVSSGFLTMPEEDFLRLVKRVRSFDLEAKPEVGVQFGAGGASTVQELEAEGTRGIGPAVRLARRCLDLGVPLVMIESEGITESVKAPRTDIIEKIVDAVGLGSVMFEAADPEVFGWYVKSFGPEVNLFVDRSQIILLESLRSGTWGTKSLWGRVVTYKPERAAAQGPRNGQRARTASRAHPGSVASRRL